MRFLIDENVIRASVNSAYREKLASHPGEPLSRQELRAIALDALLDAMLTGPSGVVLEAMQMIGSANASALERAEKGFWAFVQPAGAPITWRDSAGDLKTQSPPRVEMRVLDKDLTALCAFHSLDPEAMRRLGRAEIHEHKGWRRGGTYGKPFELTVMYTPTLEERLDPETYAEVMAEAQGYWQSRNDGKPHPLALPIALPIQIPTSNPMVPVNFDPMNPGAPLPFTWAPGQYGPVYPDPDAPKLPSGVDDEGPAHSAPEAKRTFFGRKGK